MKPKVCHTACGKLYKVWHVPAAQPISFFMCTCPTWSTIWALFLKRWDLTWGLIVWLSQCHVMSQMTIVTSHVTILVTLDVISANYKRKLLRLRGPGTKLKWIICECVSAELANYSLSVAAWNCEWQSYVKANSFVQVRLLYGQFSNLI